MELLIPATSHIITWQKQNLLDTATYYVQAVIRNARTNETLKTLNLTDLGSSNRFSGTWPVPPDPSNFGLEISIVKTVYEDSNYTTVSGVYGAWEDRYLILDFINAGRSNTGGVSIRERGPAPQTIDYGFISDMIKAAVRQADAERPKTNEIDFSEVLSEIGGVKQTLGDRLKALVGLGRKADSVRAFEEKIKEYAENIQTSVEDAHDLLGSITGVHKDLQDVAQEHMEVLKEEQDKFINRIHAAADDCLGEMQKKLGDVMSKKATEIVKSVQEDIDNILSKPIKVQSLQEMELVREKPAKEPAPAKEKPAEPMEKEPDARIKRLSAYA